MSRSTHVQFNIGLTSIEATTGSGQLANVCGAYTLHEPYKFNADAMRQMLEEPRIREYLPMAIRICVDILLLDWDQENRSLDVDDPEQDKMVYMVVTQHD